MKRVIREFNIPESGQASIFAIPPGTQGIQYNGKTYLDYLTEDVAPSDAIYVGEMQADGTVVDLVGVGIQDTFPHCFAGWNRTTPPVEKLVIELPAHKAYIMLESLGVLTQCKNICQAIGRNAEIAFERAPTIHSDNPLVHAVLGTSPGGLGKTKEEIYMMFVEANNLKEI